MEQFHLIFSDKVLEVLGPPYRRHACDTVYHLAGTNHPGDNHTTVALALQLFEQLIQSRSGFPINENQLVSLVNHRITSLYLVGKDALSPPPYQPQFPFEFGGSISPPIPGQKDQEPYSQKVHKTAWELFNRYVSLVDLATGRIALAETFDELLKQKKVGDAFDLMAKNEYVRFKMHEDFNITRNIQQAIYHAVSEGDLDFLQALKQDSRTVAYLKSSFEFEKENRRDIGPIALKYLTDRLSNLIEYNERKAISTFDSLTSGEGSRVFLDVVGEEKLEKHLRRYVSHHLKNLAESSSSSDLERLQLFIQTERGKQYKIWVEKRIASCVETMNRYVLDHVPAYFPEIALSAPYASRVAGIFDSMLEERNFQAAVEFGSKLEGYLDQQRTTLLGALRKKYGDSK